MNTQLETIKKITEFYKATHFNHTSCEKYNRYTFWIPLDTSKDPAYDSDSKYVSITGEVEEAFHGIFNSCEANEYVIGDEATVYEIILAKETN